MKCICVCSCELLMCFDRGAVYVTPVFRSALFTIVSCLVWDLKAVCVCVCVRVCVCVCVCVLIDR